VPALWLDRGEHEDEEVSDGVAVSLAAPGDTTTTTALLPNERPYLLPASVGGRIGATADHPEQSVRPAG
jgi:hypothetical protein